MITEALFNYLLSIYMQASQNNRSLNSMKRSLKVQQPPAKGSGKKLKSLSVVDALEKAEEDEASLLQAEQVATTAWTSASRGVKKTAALKALEAAKKATLAKRNEVNCLRQLLEDKEQQAIEQGEEDEDDEEAEEEDKG